VLEREPGVARGVHREERDPGAGAHHRRLLIAPEATLALHVAPSITETVPEQ
jgi:hypothetical protein